MELCNQHVSIKKKKGLRLCIFERFFSPTDLVGFLNLIHNTLEWDEMSTFYYGVLLHVDQMFYNP